jgi:hypothetical protein
LEFEVVDDPQAAEPEDWDLQSLKRAVEAGMATPLRTIRGLVIDSERDCLSGTLEAFADDLDETVQLHWLATAKPWPSISWRLRRRPTIQSLVELEALETAIRDVAARLRQQGL